MDFGGSACALPRDAENALGTEHARVVSEGESSRVQKARAGGDIERELRRGFRLRIRSATRHASRGHNRQISRRLSGDQKAEASFAQAVLPKQTAFALGKFVYVFGYALFEYLRDQSPA